MFKASVIIPTYNGAKKIINIIEALSKQTISDFEIVIGIDGSTDNTYEILKEQNLIPKDRINIYTQKNKGRAIIRNNTAKLAETDLLIFYDDDMLPLSDSVKKHIDFHSSNSNSILGANQIDKYKGNTPDFLKFKEYLSKKWMSSYGNGITELTKDNLFLTAAHFSISKNLFFQFNGFDKNLTDAEDWDFAVRAIENNMPIFFDPTNIAYHNDYVTCKQYIKRQRAYKKSHTQLLKSKPELYSNYITRLIKPKLNRGRKMIYFIFANRLLVYLIDNFNVFKIFPKSLRYKYYDIVVTGLGRVYSKRKLL